jgi:hypothetical protein
VYQPPACTPDLNPLEGIWPVVKRGVLANLAVAIFGHLVQVIRHGLKKIPYQPGLIEGCLARTGLALDVRTQGTSRIKDLSVPASPCLPAGRGEQ